MQIEVGTLYRPGRTEYPEGTEFNYSDNGFTLDIYMDKPSIAEIEAARKGKAEFGFLVEDSIIFFLFKFKPGIPWSDAPYSYWMVPESRRSLPMTTFEPGTEAVITIVLIDASTGIVRAIRAVGLPTEFSTKLAEAVVNQSLQPIDSQTYSNAVDRAYAKYPTTLDMVVVAELS